MTNDWPRFVLKLIANANFGDGGGDGSSSDGSTGDGGVSSDAAAQASADAAAQAAAQGFDTAGGPAQTGDPNTSDPGPGPVSGAGGAFGSAAPVPFAGVSMGPDFGNFGGLSAPSDISNMGPAGGFDIGNQFGVDLGTTAPQAQGFPSGGMLGDMFSTGFAPAGPPGWGGDPFGSIMESAPPFGLTNVGNMGDPTIDNIASNLANTLGIPNTLGNQSFLADMFSTPLSNPAEPATFPSQTPAQVVTQAAPPQAAPPAAVPPGFPSPTPSVLAPEAQPTAADNIPGGGITLGNQGTPVATTNPGQVAGGATGGGFFPPAAGGDPFSLAMGDPFSPANAGQVSPNQQLQIRRRYMQLAAQYAAELGLAPQQLPPQILQIIARTAMQAGAA